MREIARREGLPNHDKRDSTGICFIGERPFREFLNRYLPANPGDIYALDGDKVTVRADQEDECTLCRLCLERAPAGTIRIRKTYTGDVLVRVEEPTR